ncbi:MULTISPECIES: HindIII family type II restriction endonuclease [Streptomyces]|uniref:HindIII family type II restriction endonuclease n=1 Tax=Streptomyces violaceoruber TaxID=1935 RepID=A0ACD4WQ56_STRVN|nr:HindIII family type II restriction endonuclease [Streptomyces sp. ME02-6978.2a]MDX3364348.1 HindIII family type II restriction endonuclease [Streptomyces sp. ME02-6978.2a]WOY99620.1 HindIII family type II restriction endonuclease [Streptomyces violaceoruber]BDD73182.1 restriction endonuclease [Streptomyces coelicolor]
MLTFMALSRVGIEVNMHFSIDAVVDRLVRKGLLFDRAAIELDKIIQGADDGEFFSLLVRAGCIPERYSHDSREEKLYAKAMDSIVAESLRRIGYQAEVSQERSNSADVVAEGGSPAHSLVADAKAFRLSRTALNPKDYKIEALSKWRKGADYAILVAPIAGYPEGQSRLYVEAGRYQVTLLSYSHLALMIASESGPSRLEDIWMRSVEHESVTLSAPQYWSSLDSALRQALSWDQVNWTEARREYFEGLLLNAEAELAYFDQVKNDVAAMDRGELVDIAVEALKIDSKMRTIRARVAKTRALVNEMEDREQ